MFILIGSDQFVQLMTGASKLTSIDLRLEFLLISSFLLLGCVQMQ